MAEAHSAHDDDYMSTYDSSKPKRRHCAFCLKSLDVPKTCGGCKRRAYCSKECQAKDWKLTGQGHKNWCKIFCGEEDLDWKVVEIPGKGLGVVAIRDIPAKTRIMVDRAYTFVEGINKEQLMDLYPEGGSYEAKFQKNLLASDIGKIVCPRLSRVNHTCVANSAHWLEDDFRVKILYSEKDIKCGEEITYSYLTHRSLHISYTPEIIKKGLFDSWGIVCPKDCPCQDPKTWELVAEAKKLSNDDLPKLFAFQQYKKAIGSANRVNEIYDLLQVGLLAKKVHYFEMFQFNILYPDTLDAGIDFLSEAAAIEACIEPYKKNSDIQKYLANPDDHENYLAKLIF